MDQDKICKNKSLRLSIGKIDKFSKMAIKLPVARPAKKNRGIVIIGHIYSIA
ncbi:hypothetical protein SESBI_04902 [Sesbania bispinosa]|nr:hypothetical protein SESBI_04902 [Sesbania bispinosa]